MRRHCCCQAPVSQAVETEVVDVHGELVVEDRSHSFGEGAVTRRSV